MTAAVDVASPSDTALGIAGTKAETAPYTNGAALAVYRGHVPNTPIWSVSFAPSGYYFCSAGGDATARLWVTDRSTSPVRLFSGHTAANVNCVEWHPNCNYVLTGSDDRTVRLWDIQTGRTVRLLDGCGAGVNTVEISPNGQYAAGADLNGVVHVWDLGMGKKITELRSQLTSQQRQDVMMIHSLSFSQCGSVLATGGDDCCVRIWDVRYETISQKPIIATPSKTFATRKTMIMDLSFTRRNLLLSVGKYVTPVPLAMDASN
jgi:transcription initiation factor TFIID subunit 5